MLGTIIFSVLFLLLTIKIVVNVRQGIILYVVFSLLSPHLNIGSIQISFEILGFFLVMPVLLLKRKSIFNMYKIGLYRQYLWLFLIILIISSLVGFTIYGSAISWISIFGYFRIICIVYMLQYVMKENPDEVLDRILWPVLYVNFAVSIIQLTIPESTNIFYDLYYKSSLFPLLQMLELGYFNRAYGTFGTPVLLGVFSLFCFAVYLGFLLEKKKCKLIYIKLITSIVIGLLALSKTVILGIPLILLAYYLLTLLGIIKKVKNKKMLLIPFLIVPTFIITIYYLEKHGTSILWYTKFLLDPFEALGTRYSSSSGVLLNAYSTIRQNWLIGVGPTAIGNDFSGDSMYIGMMYSAGIIGMIIYFSVLIGSTIRNLKRKHTTAFLCFIAICLSGFAAPIQFDIVSVALISYMFSIGAMRTTIPGRHIKS